MTKISFAATNTRLIPVKDWEKFHPWPKENALRTLIARRHKNGFAFVVVKIGGRVLIDERAFFEWVKMRRKEGY